MVTFSAMPRRVQTRLNALRGASTPLLSVAYESTKQPDATATPVTIAAFHDALARGNARRMLPDAPVSKARRLTAKVAPEVSEAIYQNTAVLRRFADRVRDGAFGDHLDWVYFIGQQSGGLVKIGVSNDPVARMTTLQVGSPVPLELLVAIVGDIALERTLHAIFSRDRAHGEWFRRSETLTEFVRILRLPKTVDV